MKMVNVFQQDSKDTLSSLAADMSRKEGEVRVNYETLVEPIKSGSIIGD